MNPTKAPTNRRQLADGTIYIVTPHGWVRQSPRRCDAKDRKGTHNHAVARRMSGKKGRV